MRVEERAAMNLLYSMLRTEQQGQEHQVKLLRKTMDAQQQTGEQLVQMIEDAGRLLDIRA
ncbi:MAG: YjfB family protein [Armatimonadota bacterium]|nr:YjfB family protein [Armatimonadota bacterium]